MKNSTLKSKAAQISRAKDKLLDEGEICTLSKIFSEERFQNIVSACREYRDRVYSPVKTVMMFLKQVLHSDKSCKNAVAGNIAEQANLGEPISSLNTGPYCKARQRLPESMVKELVQEVSRLTVESTKVAWKWQDREVKLVDGTTITMQDTQANQQAFPQHGGQKIGAGFPIVRLVAIMSLSTGSVMDYAVGAYKGKGTGELSLYRKIQECIDSDDIVLGDRYYPGFFLSLT